MSIPNLRIIAIARFPTSSSHGLSLNPHPTSIGNKRQFTLWSEIYRFVLSHNSQNDIRGRQTISQYSKYIPLNQRVLLQCLQDFLSHIRERWVVVLADGGYRPLSGVILVSSISTLGNYPCCGLARPGAPGCVVWLADWTIFALRTICTHARVFERAGG